MPIPLLVVVWRVDVDAADGAAVALAKLLEDAKVLPWMIRLPVPRTPWLRAASCLNGAWSPATWVSIGLAIEIVADADP